MGLCQGGPGSEPLGHTPYRVNDDNGLSCFAAANRKKLPYHLWHGPRRARLALTLDGENAWLTPIEDDSGRIRNPVAAKSEPVE